MEIINILNTFNITNLINFNKVFLKIITYASILFIFLLYFLGVSRINAWPDDFSKGIIDININSDIIEEQIESAK